MVDGEGFLLADPPMLPLDPDDPEPEEATKRPRDALVLPERLFVPELGLADDIWFFCWAPI